MRGIISFYSPYKDTNGIRKTPLPFAAIKIFYTFTFHVSFQHSLERAGEEREGVGPSEKLSPKSFFAEGLVVSAGGVTITGGLSLKRLIYSTHVGRCTRILMTPHLAVPTFMAFGPFATGFF